MIKSFEDRFWSNVDIKSPNECWNWIGKTKVRDYGQIRKEGKKLLAHRVSWELVNGPIPSGMVIMHKCDNPACCNPSHLSCGTHQDNMDDMNRKGRHVSRSGIENGAYTKPESVLRGEKHGSSRISEDSVRSIRQLYEYDNWTMADIARNFDLSATHVRRIVQRKSWKHVP